MKASWADRPQPHLLKPDHAEFFREVDSLRIAVCDDEKANIAKIQSVIAEIKGNYQVDVCQTGEALLTAVRQGAVYDIVFCDIYLHEENGLDTARRLQALSPGTSVVFTTTSTEHALEAFSISALHYLVKPIRTEDVIEVFRRFGMKKEPRHTLTLRIERNVTVLFQDEIVRVEGQHQRTLIFVNDTMFSIWKPYGEISALLDDSFLRIKKGVSVNMRCISQMTAQKCVMKDGCTFLLSRSTARENRERYFRFLKDNQDKR